MEQAKIEKIAETFKDEEFAKRIIKIKEKEELIKAFAEKGLELSLEEVDEFIQKGQAIIKQVKLEKIAETFKDEEFAKKIIKIKEKEELIKAFAEKGLELSTEEVNELIQKGKEAISSGEFDRITKAISEDELKNISGGAASDDFKTGIKNLTDVIKEALNTIVTPSRTDSSDYIQAIGTLAIPVAVTALASVPVIQGTKKAMKAVTSKAVTNAVNKYAKTISYASKAVCGTCLAACLLGYVT